MEHEHRRFNLREAAEASIQSFAEPAAKKGIELLYFFGTEVPKRVIGDPRKLQRVLENLIDNAIKYTEKGDVLVKLNLQSTVDGEVTVQFEVSDSGCGISEERQKHLFGDSAKKPADDDNADSESRAGLLESQELVAELNGEIGVLSDLGWGSTFWFTATYKASREPGRAHASQTVFNLRRLRVLVVDDNATHRKILYKQLSNWKIQAEVAADGFAALDILERAAESGNPFTMAVVDLVMPGMDGLELARQIKARVPIRGTILILLSAADREIDDAELKEIGIVSYVRKPPGQLELFDSILSAVSGDSLKRPSHGFKRATSAEGIEAGNEKARVLLADDNGVNQALAREVLVMAGFECDVVTTGQEAVEAALEKEYDVVLMDCQMPELDGPTAAGRIREAEGRNELPGNRDSKLPIIAMTTDGKNYHRDTCLAAGMDDFLSKPVDPYALIETVWTYLQPGAAGVERRTQLSDVVTREMVADAVLPAQPNSPPLDLDGLLRSCMGRKPLVERVLAVFEEQALIALEELAESVAAGDAEQIAFMGHKLKGMAANVSAPILRDLAHEIEKQGRKNRLEKTTDFLERLRTELKRSLDYIPEALAELEV